MKTKNFLLFVVTFIVTIANAQVANIIVTSQETPVLIKDNILVTANRNNDCNGEIKFLNSVGNQIGETRILPKRNSTACGGVGSIAYRNQNDFFASGTTDDGVSPSYNALIHYYGYGTDSIQKNVRGITLKTSIINNIPITFVRMPATHDFLNSGYENTFNQGSGTYIMRANEDLTSFWTTKISSDILDLNKMKETFDGNIAVTTNTKRWKININNGNLIGTPIESDYSCEFIEDENGYLSLVNRTDEITKTYNPNGDLIAETNLPHNNQFGIIPKDVLFDGNKMIAFSFHNSMPQISTWTKSLVNSDDYYSLQEKKYPTPWNSGVNFNEMRILEKTNSSVTVAAQYYLQDDLSFYGTNLPTPPSGVAYWVVFTYNFTLSNDEFAVNDIHSPNNNINSVYVRGRLNEDLSFDSENININYLVYNSESNIPEVGIKYINNGLWSVPSGMQEVPSGWIDDWQPIIHEDDNGQRYFYSWAMPVPLTSTLETLVITKFMLVSDGTLDVLNEAMQNNTETSLTITDYENIQVSGVSSSNIDAVNTLLENIDASNLPLTVAEIQNLVNSTLGVSNNTIDNIAVYPNPTNAIFTIKTSIATIQKIELSNINGKLIFKQNIENQEDINIDLSNYSNGIYFVKITDNKGNSINKKLVKK